MGGSIQNGKEGFVISAVQAVDDTHENWFCIKVYKQYSMEFKNKRDYLSVFYYCIYIILYRVNNDLILFLIYHQEIDM